MDDEYEVEAIIDSFKNDHGEVYFHFLYLIRQKTQAKLSIDGILS